VYRVALVCLGNICRSPMADVVLNVRLADAGLANDIEVTSCGTGTWHLGEEMDPRAVEVLTDAGYDGSRHRAQLFSAEWFDHDLILAMDPTNLADILALLPADRHDRARLFRSYDPAAQGDEAVPDPFYGGPDGFQLVREIVERTSEVLVEELRALVR
jgi:protein-tyrosine phosphatase